MLNERGQMSTACAASHSNLLNPFLLYPTMSTFFLVILHTVGLLGWVISSSQGLYPNTGQHKVRINTYTHHISVPFLGFETTIPASERVKTVHALDRSATETGPLTQSVRLKKKTRNDFKIWNNREEALYFWYTHGPCYKKTCVSMYQYKYLL
jgi:hypothetical protein